MGGFIKDYRSELRSDIWMMPPLYHRVWQYLKYKVNHSPNKIPMEDGNFFSISPGQHLTSVRSIAQGVGYYEGLVWKEPNPRTISKILEWLEKQLMISIDRGRGNRQYTLVTLLNWDSYQVNNEGGNSKTTEGTSGSKQQVHIKKNDKECLKNEKKKEVGKRVYDETSIHFQLASRLFKNILENNPNHKKPNLQAWSNDVRLMMERDKRNEEQIIYVIDWCQNDEFWKSNVLSISKLRERFDQLIIQIKSNRKKSDVPIVPVYEEVKPLEKRDGKNTSKFGDVKLFR